jgi:hypothetical protein
MRSRGEDEPTVALQHGEPVVDVAGVVGAWLEFQPKVGAQEGGAQLGDQLFPSIAVVAPAFSPKVTVEPLGMASPVGALVSQCGVVALSVVEAVKRRHLHVVRLEGVVGLAAAVADVGAGGFEESFGMGDPIDGCRSRPVGGLTLVEQPLDLLDVEDGVRLQEGDLALDVLAIVGGFGAAEGVGIDDGGAGLALADVAAERQRLSERDPHRRRVAAGDGLGPEQDDVDAAVGLAGGAEGAADAAGQMLGRPRFRPGPNAVLQVGDDGARDAGVEVRT